MNEIEVKPVENNPLAIIASGVEKGFAADQLAKLVDLYERVEGINAKKAYQQAMQACQAEMQTVVKDMTNKHTNSRYVDLGTLVHKIKPVYTKHGFSLSFGEAVCDKPSVIRSVVDVMHTGGWRETKWCDLPVDGSGSQGGRSGMNAVQGVGSTHTYARRYLIYDVFNLVIADSDLDGNSIEPTLNDEQRETLERLLLEAEQDIPKFLAWAGVDEVAKIEQRKFPNARDFLQRKIAKAKEVAV